MKRDPSRQPAPPPAPPMEGLAQENCALRVQLGECQAALAEAVRGRAAAEVVLGDVQQQRTVTSYTSRELASLQGLLRQALEEGRGLQSELAACRARCVELDAQASQLRLQLLQAKKQPTSAAHCPQPCQQELPVPAVPPAPGLSSLVAQCLADELAAVRLEASEEGKFKLGRPGCSKPCLMPRASQTSAVSGEAGALRALAAPLPASPPLCTGLAAVQQSALADVPHADLQRIYGEIAALQQRLQAAEQRLMAGDVLPAETTAHVQRAPPPCRPSSPFSPSRRAASPVGKGERKSWELIHTLKQRKARLESLQFAAAGAAAVHSAPHSHHNLQPDSSAVKAPTVAATWQQDGHSLTAARNLQQPSPPRAGYIHVPPQQRGRSAGRSTSVPRWRGTSPAAAGWQHYCRQPAAQPRGLRRSLSADRVAAPQQLVGSEPSGVGRSRSRSRQEQEEISRLLSVGRSASGRERRAWVPPVVL